MGTSFSTAAVLTLTMCGTALAQAQFEVGTPESQGIAAEAIEGLSAAVQSYVEKDYAVGAELVVIKNRVVVFHETYGLSDVEADEPWEIGTLCNIRSMSKPLTGAAAQLLIDRGQLGIDDLVAEYLPGFDTDASREITVRQVLTHRAGLPLTILEAIDQYPDLITQSNAVGEQGPEFEPESKFWYSDAGTDVVGAIVEVVSGETLDAFVTRELLEPMGMSDSFYGIDGDDPRFERIGSLYFGAANSWTRFWGPEDGPLYPFAWGSQTIYSSPLDYAKFLAMWMDDGRVGDAELLSPEAIARTVHPVSPMTMLGSDQRFPTEFQGLETYYGQMSVLHCEPADDGPRPVILGHSGSDGTIAWAWPDRDLMVLYFTQSRGGTTALRLESELDRLLINPGAATAESVPDELVPYIGTYVANFGTFDNEPFEVLVKDGGLALDIPSQMVFALNAPDEEGRWAFALVPDQVQVTFGLNDGGTADVLFLHQAGSTFEVPRRGSARADELSKKIVVAPEVLASLAGTYRDPESDRSIEVFVSDDGELSVRAEQNLVLGLRPSPDVAGRWLVRQSPAISLSFQRDEEGNVVSMTRHRGEQTLVMSRED